MAGEDLKESKSSDKKKLQKSYFDVLGLCCSSEVPLIENILKSLDGVKEVSVIVPSRTVIVVHDNLIVSQLQIVKALNQARLEANVRANGGTKYQKKWPSPYAIACGILLGISFLKYIFYPMRWFAIAAVAVGIFPIVLKAFASLRNFRLDINLLVLIAVVGTVAMNDYTEAGTIVFLFTIAEWLETRASHKATAVMSSLMSIAPPKAVIAETGEEVDASEVKLNTILAVKAGEVIPIDGIVVDGKCEVDEKTLTGESYPVSKPKDSTVWAGTMNLNGYISVKTTALAEDCVVAKMAKLVEEAQNSKSKTQRLVDKCAQFYTPAVIIISACLAVIPAALRVHNRNHWFHLALVVLVSACPCALILSTPVVTFCALTKAATSGLLVKGGDYLEILAKVKVVAFDKTGTITRGEFIVSDFQSLSEDINLNTLLYWVSSIENKSSHPMAAALVEYGRSHSVEPKPEDVEDYRNFPGEGIYGKIGGKGIYIGNKKIAQRAARCATVPSIKRFKSKGNTIGYIYSGASLVGIFSLSDACRSGAAQAIKELKSLGIRTAMLTGDNQSAAMHAQEQLGNALDVVHAELLPEDKAKIIHQFKQEGKTAMIGDGINDAPALATADIGISMGISGSALATETGNVILMSNDIRKIPEAIQLARTAHWKVIENIILSITTKAAILALAFEGHPLVWAAVLADVGTCLLVIFNSMLLLQRTHKHGGKCSKYPSSHAHKHGKKCCKPSGKKCKSSDATKNKNHGGKCCQSSAELDAHKQGCESNHSHPSQSKQQNCYSDISNAQKPCEPEKCFSHGCAPTSDSSSCCSSTCGDNQCCSDGNTKEEDRHCDHGSCDKDAHDIEAQKCCNTSLRTKITCSKSAEKQGNCGEDHSNSSTRSEECHEMANSAHCHPIHCGEKHVLSHTNAEASGNDCCGHQHQTSNAIPVLKNCCTDHTVSDSMQSMARSACMSLEKREIGGCCKSYYMNQCCGKHVHFRAGFGGGSMTEIVTE